MTESYLHRNYPTTPIFAGILVLHAWWGLNSFIKYFSQELADLGYLVYTPDLFKGKTASSVTDAKKLRSSVTRAHVKGTIRNAWFELVGQPEITAKRSCILGLSFGGHWALWLSDEPGINSAATVVFYASRGGGYNRSQSAYLCQFAENDEFVSANSVVRLQKSLEKAGREAKIVTYPGTQHWFFEKDRPEYDPQAAGSAWKKTVQFLNEHLVG